MTPKVEKLWQRVLAELTRRGIMPLRAEPLTPQEIAAHVSMQDGDARVHRFVHQYLYPTHFGHTVGLLSEREAEELVEAFESGRWLAADSGDAPPALPEPPAPRVLCSVCNHRPPSQHVS